MKDTTSLSTELPAGTRERFWERFTLDELNEPEWEALCDGCGRCCLLKLEDEDTGEVAQLDIACRLLDIHSCRCANYAGRFTQVPDCTRLTRANLARFNWLPASCAYRRLAEGRRLASWHPLLAGNARRMHRHGISVRHLAVSEKDVSDDEWPDHIIAIF